jgi:hypothetical protein
MVELYNYSGVIVIYKYSSGGVIFKPRSLHAIRVFKETSVPLTERSHDERQAVAGVLPTLMADARTPDPARRRSPEAVVSGTIVPH